MALDSEVKLTVELAKLFPNNSVRIVAADETRNSLLMEDYGRRSLQELLEEPDRALATVEGVLSVYSTMQIGTADHVDKLLSIGIPDQRLNILASDFEAILSEVEHLRIEIPGILTDEDIRGLQALAPEVWGRCERLGRFEIPQTIEHGDFIQDRFF